MAKSHGVRTKARKTRITHTLNGEEPGFDFLGFNIRQYPVGQRKSGKNSGGKPLGYKTLIKPSKKSIEKHKKRLSEVVTKHKGAPQFVLIQNLNPIIKGWTNYFRCGASKEVFSELDSYLWTILYKWAKKRHPKKTGKWCAKKYWNVNQSVKWQFTGKTDAGKVITLLRHSDTEIVRHIKVRGATSPYDGNLTYWSTRLGRSPEMSARVAELLKRQKGKCNWYGLYFRDGDKMEVDRIIPKSQGGKDIRKNWQLLHLHCHDEKTAKDGSLCTKQAETGPHGNLSKQGSSAHDKGGTTEEPDEMKISRPVLKTPRGGDSLA